MQTFKHLKWVTHHPTREAYQLTLEIPCESVNNQNAFNNIDTVNTLLQIVPVIIKNGNTSVKTNALLDSGSDVTLTNKDLTSKLNLSGDSKVLNICNAILEVSKVECKTVKFQISSVCNSLQKLDINGFVVVVFSQIVPKFHHLKMIISI